MDKLNGLIDRWRGPLAIIISISTIVGWLILLRTDLGYATKRPAERLGQLEAEVQTIKAEVGGLRSQTRPLLIELCFTASDTVLSLISDDVDCDTFIRRRGVTPR